MNYSDMKEQLKKMGYKYTDSKRSNGNYKENNDYCYKDSVNQGGGSRKNFIYLKLHDPIHKNKHIRCYFKKT